ncbi:MAG: site-specific DNA-methyltransferase [Chromatiales bacterium]|nr:site-specific DNA-methyltransferase [Chromatiales bacterium]
MKKLTADDPASRSPDLVAENLERLKVLFPELVTEGPNGAAVNVDVLKALVGDATVTDADEKYGLNWHGKRRARQLALTPSTGTLRPCPEDSVDWDTTQNLMIEGDNLEVLKLLQKSYAGKVKLIYIDPPYNTGKDFVYPDSFQDSIKNYLKLTGQVEAGAKISSNTEASGRFHTDWLNMMYPRLKAMQSLLERDGAIFVSCDETEQARLRLAMDDIFGSENFVADMVWAAGRKNDSRLISVSHEYIVCYARDAGYLTSKKVEWRQRKKGLADIYRRYEQLKTEFGSDYATMTAGMKEWYKGLADAHPAKAHKHYNHVDARGVFFPADISWPGGGGPMYEVLHPKTKRPVKVPARGWITPDPAKMTTWIDEDRVHFGEDEAKVPCLKAYLRDQEYQAPYSVFYQDGRSATKRLRGLMGGDCFDFPKDETVLQEIVEMLTSGDDVVMDCFAGSGTTGHATMAQNAIDSGNRRYILVQLPEPLDPENKDQKAAAGFCDNLGKLRNIAELTKERLRRAAKKVKDDNPMFAGDLGFRVFKLDSSNIRAWVPDCDDLDQGLLDSVDHLEPDRTEFDVLYELLLKRGLDLCVPIETRVFARMEVHAVGGGVLMACLAEKIEVSQVEALAQGIVEWHQALIPAGDTTCVFRDSAFADDVAKTNMAAILEQHGIAHVRSL